MLFVNIVMYATVTKISNLGCKTQLRTEVLFFWCLEGQEEKGDTRWRARKVRGKKRETKWREKKIEKKERWAEKMFF